MILKEKMKFKIVPENIDNTFETEIIEVNDDNISFPILNNALKEGEKFDAYMFSRDGIIFFSANIEKIENNIAKINTGFAPELLQRRQYARVKVDKEAVIKEQDDETKSIKTHLCDISVGGFKLISKENMNKEKLYVLEINLNGNDLLLPFSLINIIEEADKTYIISARFENMQNTDKIALVQYCYKKQAEDVEE